MTKIEILYFIGKFLLKGAGGWCIGFVVACGMVFYLRARGYLATDQGDVRRFCKYCIKHEVARKDRSCSWCGKDIED